MRSFWSEPFLWIHLSGLAAFPLFLALVWLGLGVGDRFLSELAELFLLAVVGTFPVLLMQLLRPFYIFSILAVSTKPTELTQQQRCLLSQFKTSGNKLPAFVCAVFSLWLLWRIYYAPPLAAAATFPSQWRLAGLLLAGLAFLGGNLFLQVPLSVARVLLKSESEFAATEPYPLERIKQDFTIPGWLVNKILSWAPTEPAVTKNDRPTAK